MKHHDDFPGLHSDKKHKKSKDAGHHPASHRVMASHQFEDHNPNVLPSMYAKMVTSENKKHAKTRVPGSRDDFTVPSQMHGATRNVQKGPGC